MGPAEPRPSPAEKGTKAAELPIGAVGVTELNEESEGLGAGSEGSFVARLHLTRPAGEDGPQGL